MNQLLGDLPGVKTDIDNILVWDISQESMMSDLKLSRKDVNEST